MSRKAVILLYDGNFFVVPKPRDGLGRVRVILDYEIIILG